MWLPRHGGSWPSSAFWGFVPEMRPKYRGCTQSICVVGIMKAWNGIRKGIVCRWRNDAYARMYMPIVWNPLIRDVDGLMIGQKAGFKWANLINAQGNTLADWKRFLRNDVGTQKARIWRINRGKCMLMRITDAFARSGQILEEAAISPSEMEWTGLIDAENYIIGIKGTKAGSNEACYYKIEHRRVICEQPAYQTERPIRLLAKNGKAMIVDPEPSELKPTTVCWPIEGHSNQLSWDPAMYFWKTQGQSDGAKLVQFFRYNTKIGRQIILKQEHQDIAARKFWIQEGISERRLAKFWKMIWHDSGDRKIMMCLWLIVHRALPVGAWAKGPNVDPRCSACGQLESISHCLWECHEATAVWRRALRLLCHASSSFTLKWGHACWNCLDDDVEKFDSTCKAMYRGENGTIRLIIDNIAPTSNAQKQKIGDLWMLLAPIIIWSIWTTRCTRVFSTNKQPPVESIKLIWHISITILRAQYEQIHGTYDASKLMRLNFKKQ